MPLSPVLCIRVRILTETVAILVPMLFSVRTNYTGNKSRSFRSTFESLPNRLFSSVFSSFGSKFCVPLETLLQRHSAAFQSRPDRSQCGRYQIEVNHETSALQDKLRNERRPDFIWRRIVY